LIGAFKTVSTKRINALRGSPGMPVWQRNYYEHVIRDESEFNRILEYVINNPAAWDKDEGNPAVANDVCQTDFCGTINCANE
jgi:REP element-mobilizing transposase RayT